jgi:hypothetical protein
MNIQFLYVLAGWEGSASDSCVFENALRKGFVIPKDPYYLADVGYANCNVLLASYWGVCYHLRKWGMGNKQCVYLIFPSHAIVDLCYLGPGTTRNSLTFSMCSLEMSSSASLKP